MNPHEDEPNPQDDHLITFDYFEIQEPLLIPCSLLHGAIQPRNFIGQELKGIRRGYICGQLVEAAHGFMKPDGFSNPLVHAPKQPCSLLIFEWSVHTDGPGYRVHEAHINMAFKAKDPRASMSRRPWIADFAPRGACSLFQTARSVEKASAWEENLTIGGSSLANAGVKHSHEKKETVYRRDGIYLDGSPSFLGPQTDHPDKITAVEWSLWEAESLGSGVPRLFRTAVLLNRMGDSTAHFYAKVDVEVSVGRIGDTLDRLTSWIGRRRPVKNDPLEFDPSLAPRGVDFEEKLDSLGGDSIKLDDLIFFKMYQNDGKVEGQEGRNIRVSE